MNEIYEKTITVDTTDADLYDHLRPDALLRYFQNIGTEHSALLGMGREYLRGEFHSCWILTRVWFGLNRPIHAGETIRLRTWNRGITGIQVYRDFQLLVGEEQVGTGVSAWAVADVDSRRLLRPRDIPGISQAPVPEGIAGKTLKLIREPEDKTFAFEKTVRYADLDVNGHMNNTKYADILLDAFTPEEMRGRYLSGLQLNYSQECRFGEKLTVSRQRVAEEFYIDGCGGDGLRRFEARVHLAPLDGGAQEEPSIM